MSLDVHARTHGRTHTRTHALRGYRARAAWLPRTRCGAQNQSRFEDELALLAPHDKATDALSQNRSTAQITGNYGVLRVLNGPRGQGGRARVPHARMRSFVWHAAHRRRTERSRALVQAASVLRVPQCGFQITPCT